MIKLSKRLDAIANLIDKEDTVIDIGCDHALMTISLALKNNKTYYASDLSNGAICATTKTISSVTVKRWSANNFFYITIGF